MKVIETAIPEVLLLEPQVFGDERGFFLESYNKKELHRLGIGAEFVQDNHSRSKKKCASRNSLSDHASAGKTRPGGERRGI